MSPPKFSEADVFGYLFCCVMCVPIGSTLLWIGSGVYAGATRGDWRSLNPGILMFEIFVSVGFTFVRFGFYPADFNGTDTINLWPWILISGLVLFCIAKFAIRRARRSEKS